MQHFFTSAVILPPLSSGLLFCWFAIINLNGAFRYTLLSIGEIQLVSYQYAFLAYVLLSAVFIVCGRLIYGKYQIIAR